ncbi:MAG TPA: phasin family protein [Vicinamibacteria bacterium]
MKTSSKKTKSRPAAAPKGRSTAEVLREKWQTAVKSLSAAEAEVEKQIRHFVARNKMGQDAARALGDLGQKLERERRRAAKELEGGMARVQGRLQEERRNLGRRVDDAVHRALVAFNIPSRKEVGELTRKVDELSRKIDSFRAPRRRTVAVRKAARKATRKP